MKNEELIYEYNSGFSIGKPKNIRLLNGKIIVDINNKKLDNETVKIIVNYINYINYRYGKVNIPIVFNFKHIMLLDKLSFVILECIFKSLITKYKRKIEVVMNIERIILTEGIYSSPLLILANPLKKISEKNSKFLEKFKYDYYKYHFRRVLKYEEYSNTDKLSKIYDDVAYFQECFNINYDCREEISEVIVELLGNAIEHSKSDCLVDFDIAPNYINNCGESVCGINIAILNFSHVLLGDGISNMITNNTCNNLDGKYSRVKSALNNHKMFFDNQYDEKDFFIISTFQNRVSSRGDCRPTGGTGLTKLIKSIEEKSENHACYVLTGDRIIIFNPEYLEYNNDWIGFNSANDYFNEKPHPGLLQRSSFYMPGTAYNLNFIMKVNEDGKELF